MDVSSQDPPLMAMDLSKSYNPRTCSRSEALDLAKKPEWYHRRPAGCGADVTSPFRTRTPSSYVSTQPGGEALGSYVSSALSPGVDLYHDGVRGGGLWPAGFYGSDQSGGAVPESSGGEESDSGSDVIFLVSSAKEPLLCGPFLPDGPVMAPASPALSSPDEGAGCFLLSQPISSLSPDSSYSEDSSDSSVDIPAQHSRPVVLLSDLAAIYANRGDSAADVSSNDSEVVEVSVNKDGCWRNGPPGEAGKAPPTQVRRSARKRKSASKTPPLTRGGTRACLKRRVKHDAVGIYNESGDSDELMAYAATTSSSEDSVPPPVLERQASSGSERSGVHADRKSLPRELRPRHEAPLTKTRLHRKATPLGGTEAPAETRRTSPPRLKRTKTAARRKRRRPRQPGPPALFPPAEPEIKLRYADAKEKKSRKPDGFGPFVHVERRFCWVVNHQDDRAAVGPGGAAPASGFTPTTSCFQLGRLGAGGPDPVAPACCLCRQPANAAGLGDLHGPYYPSRPPPHGPTSRTSLQNSSEDDGGAADPDPPGTSLDECWVHEDCGVWSAGVFLVRGRLYGLREAARLAQQTVCAACHQSGAVVGCFQKGCCRSYHYTCAVQSGCVLNEENFSMRCPEHKNKLFTTTGRRRRR